MRYGAPGAHAGGRNSGVLHAGIYYQSGTPKGVVKIGPTAIPALSKENYGFFDHIKKDELAHVLKCNARKLLSDKNYLLLGIKEMSKYVPQLFDKSKQELAADFIVETHENSIHVLNAVSPAFTSSLAFAEYVVGHIK